jgi:3-isopropylmalate dehydrogenase
VLKLTSGLFLETCRSVGSAYPDIDVEDYHVDAMAALLIRRPQSFDVILTTNMFGDILSSLTAELVGSLGLGCSVNAGETHAMAQAAHGAAPELAGRDRANPAGEMLSAVLLLRWIANRHSDQCLLQVANRIEAAVSCALSDGVRTPDLGGTATASSFTNAVAQRL